MVKIGKGRGKTWTFLEWSNTKEGILKAIKKLPKSAKVKYITDDVTYERLGGWGAFGIGTHITTRDKARRAKKLKGTKKDGRRR